MKEKYEPMTLEDIKYGTKRVALLRDYIINEYQEDADLSPESLIAEYNYLAENNLLHRLFEGEVLFSTDRMKDLYDA